MSLDSSAAHRRYLARAYAEARAWRAGFPADFTQTRYALNAYIKSLRDCWAIERRWAGTFADFYKKVDTLAGGRNEPRGCELCS